MGSQEQHYGFGWHRDDDYSKLSHPEDVVTVAIALSPCNQIDGCIAYKKDESQEEWYLEMSPGQFSVHSSTALHCGGTNRTHRRRDLCSFRYMPAWVRPCYGSDDFSDDWAVLIQGEDRYQWWKHLPPPRAEWDEESMARQVDLYQKRWFTVGNF